MADVLVGRVYSVVYNQDDYYILNFDALGYHSTKAKGRFYGLLQVQPEVPIKLVGKWTQHARYGREFVFQSWEPWAEDVEGIKAFLNVCVPGFADLRLVDALVGRYGHGTFDCLTSSRSAIQAEGLSGVSSDALDHALLGWERTLAQRDLSMMLKEGGLGATDIQAAMVKFGMEASKILKENPFRLMDVAGISFAKVDRFAAFVGVEQDDPRRVQGAVLWALQEASRQGHLYLRRAELGSLIADLSLREAIRPLPLGSNPTGSFNTAVLSLLKSKSAVLDSDAGLYLPDLHLFERGSAKILSKLLLSAPIDIDLKPFLEDYERIHRIQLSEAQRKAVELLTHHRVLVITGLPGTGKTTVLRALVRLLGEAKLSFALMAPTGIAAKRLSAVTGHQALTVHRTLRFDGANWGHHENNRFLIDAVVLDEASMMDQELFYRLLNALRPETRLVFVGDDAQLPSVGPGNVLHELIDCEKVPHVRLTEIFRQAVKGEIVVNSHRINSGKLPNLNTGAKESEFRFVRLSEEERIVDLIVAMATKLKSLDANFQVLSPKYEGTVGVFKLNERLRDALNPSGPKEERYGDQTFRQGDRLMVVQNDYDLGVYNGDVGKLMEINKEGVLVKIHGIGGSHVPDEMIFFKKTTAENKLRLAYAITAHKSQGSEFDTIIMPIVRSQGRMLQRNLLYTAVTRARKRVWLIGEDIAVQKAVENNKVIKRNTALSRALTYCLEHPDPEPTNGATNDTGTG